MENNCTNDNDIRNKKLTFKDNAPFGSFISIINNTSIGNAEDLHSHANV